MELWDEIKEMLDESNHKIVIYESKEIRNDLIEKMRISNVSALGCIISHTSAIVIDDWVRVLGSGFNDIKDIIAFNNDIPDFFNNMFIVSTDIVGGMYALNIGKYSTGLGKIWYFAPDTLEWENLEMEYSEFISWLAKGNLNEFYETMRWKNWKTLGERTDLNSGILIYPFLWSNEIKIEEATKKIVPFKELININLDYIKKFEI